METRGALVAPPARHRDGVVAVVGDGVVVALGEPDDATPEQVDRRDQLHVGVVTGPGPMPLRVSMLLC